ncbi:MAG: sugar transferase [Verrucomicrobiae bacterium]|jgi:lipopolysaccharide/colanic/teichoic acid biosynthesis glycosyltransferase|nr:sugar transferase [Verrucomicrobiae bacterium]
MVKRTFDIFFSLGWLIFFSPLLALVALLVRLKLGSPILFLQERPGRHGKPFKVVKFRTMTDGVDAQGQPLPDEVRLTAFGKFLRSTTLDEFPQMWNVLLGDMSVVGPRPLLMRYLPRYNAFQAQRMLVKPGVTGWAQVNGRNALTWDEKFALDVWYVQNQSLWLDLRIVVKTFFVVFGRRNVNSQNAATMEEFMGDGK